LAIIRNGVIDTSCMHMKKLLLSIFVLTSMHTVLGRDKAEYSLNYFAIYDYNLDAFFAGIASYIFYFIETLFL
jgi:hypothetical protein